MALDFPSSPTLGQKYPPSPLVGIPTYVWDSEKWTTIGVGFSGATFPGFLWGLTLSTAGASTSFAVAAGVATDSVAAGMMTLTSALTKTTGAWAVGASVGALDVGTIAASTWYHVYLIKRPDTGVVDVLISLSATAPTMPTNYALWRRIGSMKTNGSSQWIAFIQDGDTFQWYTSIADVAASNPGTAAVTRTMNTPLGVRVEGLFNVGFATTGGQADGPAGISISDLAVEDVAPGSPITCTFSNYAAASNSNIPIRVFTNTLSQVRSRVQISGATFTLHIRTWGWIDRRGRDA